MIDAERISGDACGNWVWLCEIERRDAALDIAAGTSAMPLALSRHFDVVHQIAMSAEVAELTRVRSAEDGMDNVESAVADEPFALDYPDESFDCVTLHGTLEARDRGPFTVESSRARDMRILREARRLLRPGGWLYVATSNPLWYGRVRHPFLLARGVRVLHRASPAFVAAAGFADVRTLYAFPTHERPQALIPATRSAALAFESIDERGQLGARVRRAAGWTPLYRALVPSLVYLARAAEYA